MALDLTERHQSQCIYVEIQHMGSTSRHHVLNATSNDRETWD